MFSRVFARIKHKSPCGELNEGEEKRFVVNLC